MNFKINLRKINKFRQKIISYPKFISAKNRFSKFNKPYRLHIGCGSIKLENWINIDIQNEYRVADIVWNVGDGFPFIKNQSCSLIYNEHFLEHLTIEKADIFLSECYRILETNGVLRIAMPSLEYVVEKYKSEEWKDQDWLKWNGHDFIKTRAEMINVSFRWWGHQWLYDREELHRRLSEAGFKIIEEKPWGMSNISNLNGLESRKDSLLIFEATK